MCLTVSAMLLYNLKGILPWELQTIYVNSLLLIVYEKTIGYMKNAYVFFLTYYEWMSIFSKGKYFDLKQNK